MKRIALLFFLLAGIASQAKPLAINFEDMMAKSKSILIGTYLGEYVTGKTFHIEVDSVVKGANKSGIVAVNKAKGIPRLNPGTKVMAFINDQDQWEWVGLSDNFRSDIIYLSGIYDYNSYEVYPNAISLVQMSDFMKHGKFSGAIEGNLRFWSFDKSVYESSFVYFAITYTYFNSDSVTTQYLAGGLKLGEFSAAPTIYFAGNSVVLTYDDNLYRPLQIGGVMDSLKSNGRDYVANFEVWQPMNMNFAQFNQYVANEQYGPLCYDLTIMVNARPGDAVIRGNHHSFVYGEEDGDIGYMLFAGRRIDCTQFSLPTDDQCGILKFGTWSQPEIEIELHEVSPLIDYQDVRAMPGDRMINILKFTQLTGEMFVYENGVRVSRGTCVIVMEGTRFTENLNWNNN